MALSVCVPGNGADFSVCVCVYRRCLSCPQINIMIHFLCGDSAGDSVSHDHDHGQGGSKLGTPCLQVAKMSKIGTTDVIVYYMSQPQKVMMWRRSK